MLYTRGNVTSSFAEHHDFPEKMNFTHGTWVGIDNTKPQNKTEQPICFENAIYRVLHQRYILTASFVKHLNFTE